MNNFKILLVDDSPIVRMVISKQLEVLGLTINLAEDGLLAVAAVEETAFDLIFMDVMMPNMDGLEATKQIRNIEAEEKRRPTIIIGVTGYTNRTDCIAAGMDDFLFKPVTIEQLKGSIKQWLPDEGSVTKSPRITNHNISINTSALAEQRLADLKLRLGFKGVIGP